MIPMLTSKYYLIRMVKSKDVFDFNDAFTAYVSFKKGRIEEAQEQYCQSVKQGDFVSAAGAVMLPLY